MGTSDAKSGRRPERLAVETTWKDAMKRAIEKPKPEGGWPERPKKKRARRKAPKR